MQKEELCSRDLRSHGMNQSCLGIFSVSITVITRQQDISVYILRPCRAYAMGRPTGDSETAGKAARA